MSDMRLLKWPTFGINICPRCNIYFISLPQFCKTCYQLFDNHFMALSFAGLLYTKGWKHNFSAESRLSADIITEFGIHFVNHKIFAQA